jgi:hypothetical protein
VDLESTLDELYALRPQEFTAARDARAAEARRAGDRELADRIRALRRPTLSAWAGNLLVRREPERIRPLISLGEGLRDAHRNLDGEQLRELGRQQHLLVGALAREARRLAAEAGQPVGESAVHEIEATLHAVLADPDAARQWAAGHLDKPLSAPVGFTGLEAGADAGPEPAARRTRTENTVTAETTESTETAEITETTDRTGPADRRRREKLDRARQDARAAEEQARESEQARAEATAALERERADFEEARERAASLARELEGAQDRQGRAESALREARDRARRAERTARDARRRADKAGAAADRLSSDGG